MVLVLFLWLLFICSDCFSYLTSLGRRHNRTQRGPAERLFHSSSSRIRDGHEEVFVVVNGLPGPMALETAKACIDRGLKVAPVALTGPNYSPQVLEIKARFSTIKVDLVPNSSPAVAIELLNNLKSTSISLVVVDYTHPRAVLGNVDVYTRVGCDFVLGTTGEDYEMIEEKVSKGKNYAVIAPNMAKQIVALQLGLQDIASRFPGSFEGYKLTVVESHQSNKADTSGTAKAFSSYMARMTNRNFSVEDIEMIREKTEQLRFGVPESALGGHAFHTYKLISPDESVTFELQHNVCGRRVYAEGTVDAILFLAQVSAFKENKRLYNMIDVLDSGKMVY